MVTLIYETVHGSRAYGLATEESDTDLKGVIIGPPAWYLGFRPSPEQLEPNKDHVRYELRKLLRLAVAANPTVLEVLWTPAEHHRVVTPAGERLLNVREMFLTRKIKDTFGGYALGQLKRIKTHRRWLLHPPHKEPRRSDFGLPERKIIPGDQLGAAEAMIEQGRLEEADLTPNFLKLLEREKAYRQARREWEQYRTWLRSRNPVRADLERRFGYDTKHAQHMIRLLRMALEALESGRLRVARPDADELRAIRKGVLTYDELIEEAEKLHRKIGEASTRSTLPESCDEEAAEKLCLELVSDTLFGG